MTADNGQTAPANKTVFDDRNIKVRTIKLETATSCYPGVLVKKGTNDDDAVVGTEALGNEGWLSYEHTPKYWQPATEATIFLQNAQAGLVRGPGIGVNAWVASGEAAVVGVMMKGTTAGQLAVAGATDAAVAVALETKTGGSGGSRLMVRSLI